MNRRINLLVIFSILGWNHAFSQTHFFSLSDQKIEIAKPFNLTDVIDARSEKSNIGWTQKGMMNIKVNANFPNPADKEILNFLKANLDSEGSNIQIILRTLKISEITGFSNEQGFCELSLDFILESNGQRFRIIQSTHNTVVKGLDVTKKHPGNIANAFKLCFDELSSLDLTDTKTFVALPSDKSLEIPDSIQYNFPIFKQEIKTGIYATYDELKNNIPSSTEDLILEKRARNKAPWIGTFEIIPKFEKTNKKVKKVWGIAHEGQVYIYHQKEFFPLTIEEYDLYFYGYGVLDNGGISTGAFVGGPIGAGIASGIENSNAKKQKVKYFLAPNTGGTSETILEEEVK